MLPIKKGGHQRIILSSRHVSDLFEGPLVEPFWRVWPKMVAWGRVYFTGRCALSIDLIESFLESFLVITFTKFSRQIQHDNFSELAGSSHADFGVRILTKFPRQNQRENSARNSSHANFSVRTIAIILTLNLARVLWVHKTPFTIWPGYSFFVHIRHTVSTRH